MPKSRHYKKPFEQRRIAHERIMELFRQAELRYAKQRPSEQDKKLADRYVSLARRLSMRYKVSIPRELRRRFCRHCYSYLKPGVNCRVRVQKHRVIYLCMNCRNFMRFVLTRRSKAKPQAQPHAQSQPNRK